jgi:hypothetical protein
MESIVVTLYRLVEFQHFILTRPFSILILKHNITVNWHYQTGTAIFVNKISFTILSSPQFCHVYAVES